jgi:membrane associated rhomboid family serine protease
VSTSRFVPGWIAASLVVSIAAAVDGGWTASWLGLVPSRVWHGEVWRLVTWALLLPRPITLIMTCLAIYRFGTPLANHLEDRRLRRFMVETVVFAAVVTCVLAFLCDRRETHVAGLAPMFPLVIAWARHFPTQRVALYGAVPIAGPALTGVLLGMVVLLALAFGFFELAIDLVACVAALLYPMGWFKR